MDNTNFLEDYTKLHEGTEVPDIFALWCGVSGLSAMLGRRVFLDMGPFTIYPNVFVVLVAGSGRCRKSTAVKAVRRLIVQTEVPPKIIAQKITPEALIDALRTQEKKDGKILVKRCEGFVFADELSTFLNKKTYESGLSSLLIQFYDCEDRFEYHTRGRGKEVAHNVCLGLLGASTVDWIRNAIPFDAIGGGLTSRIIFVYVEKPPPPVAVPRYTEEKLGLMEKMVRHLRMVARLKGEVKLTKEAWDFYKESYDTFYVSSPFFDEENLSGYASRRHVHLLKVGMAFASSELSINKEGHLLVERKHLEGSELLLSESEKLMPRVLALISSSEKGSLVEALYNKILSKGSRGMRKDEIVRSLSHRLSARDINDIIDILVHSNRIRLTLRDGKAFYHPTKPLP